MNTYTIVPVTGKPQWETVPWLYAENHQWMPEADIRMGAQICYSEKGLHVHMRAWEKNIRAEFTEPLDPVCMDSCMEFFFSPVADDLRYFNVEMNPNGCIYLGFGTGRHDRIRFIYGHGDLLEDKQVNRLEDGWEQFYTFPLSLLQQFFPGYELTPGRKIPANCFKCGELTDPVHFITWNKIDTAEPDFHQRQFFGEMVLG